MECLLHSPLFTLVHDVMHSSFEFSSKFKSSQLTTLFCRVGDCRKVWKHAHNTLETLDDETRNQIEANRSHKEMKLAVHCARASEAIGRYLPELSRIPKIIRLLKSIWVRLDFIVVEFNVSVASPLHSEINVYNLEIFSVLIYFITRERR